MAKDNPSFPNEPLQKVHLRDSLLGLRRTLHQLPVARAMEMLVEASANATRLFLLQL